MIDPFEKEKMNDLIDKGKICPYCLSPTIFTNSREIYDGRDFGMIYICRPCMAWVGCHRGTERAMGRLANAELRAWRKAAHGDFDRRAKKMESRMAGYKWLSEQMGLTVDKTHIGMFDIDQCKQVIKICGGYLPLCTTK